MRITEEWNARSQKENKRTLIESTSSYTAEPLTGEQLAAAIRGQVFQYVFYDLKKLTELMAPDLADLEVYVKYWNEVSAELMHAASPTKGVTFTDVFDEVNKRLAVAK